MVNAPPEGEEAAARRGKKARAPKNVLTRMSVHSGSPLGELYRCVQERIRVRVHIRTFKGLRGVCSGFLVAFDKFWNMALVDVDETYRRPLLGEAINHERALTITRLFDRLRLQESGAPVMEGQEKAADGSVAADRMNAPQLRRSPRKRAGTDPRTVQGSRGSEEARGTGSRGLRVAGQGHDSSAQTEAGVQPRTGQAKPRVDYQQVHTRHINQLFIRGENVLLVNLQEL
ncbi:LSM11 protein, partial [Amia calva]|nr:LSM11 protein [Amia calva]